jgi:L-ascorbate metabolism protein UlaG (beta-lactamase superfamily)
MSARTIHNYSLPVSLGGSEHPDPGVVTLRWFGTASFELAFGDRVLLLDNYYKRSPRDRPLGFAVEDVTRADLLVIGHPHGDHVGDTAAVSRRTDASAVIAELGADFLLGKGVSADRIHSVTGRGEGEVLDYDDYTVRALHGFHLSVDLTPERRENLQAFQQARAAVEADFYGAPTAEENTITSEMLGRGVHTPEVNTEATLTYIIDIGGFTIAYRDSGGAISDEERAFVAAHGGVDVAILSINGLPQVRQQLEDVFLPLVRLYQPKVLIPAHHDEMWGNLNDGVGLRKLFNDVATEPLKERVHDELPGTITVQPGLIEPVTIDRAKGDVTLGELRLQ